MIASLKQLFNKGQDVAHKSAVDYLAVDVSAEDYTANPQPVFRGIYVGTAGDLTIVSPVTGQQTTFVGLPVGVYPFAGTKIIAATTTAENLIVLF